MPRADADRRPGHANLSPRRDHRTIRSPDGRPDRGAGVPGEHHGRVAELIGRIA